jgi:hypothetical protein
MLRKRLSSRREDSQGIRNASCADVLGHIDFMHRLQPSKRSFCAFASSALAQYRAIE